VVHGVDLGSLFIGVGLRDGEHRQNPHARSGLVADLFTGARALLRGRLPSGVGYQRGVPPELALSVGQFMAGTASASNWKWVGEATSVMSRQPFDRSPSTKIVDQAAVTRDPIWTQRRRNQFDVILRSRTMALHFASSFFMKVESSARDMGWGVMPWWLSASFMPGSLSTFTIS